MLNLRLIRFSPQIRLSPRILRGAECAFWFLLALALAVCGRTALSGIPVLAESFYPGHLSTAEAPEAYHPQHVADLPMTEHRPPADPLQIANATALAGHGDVLVPDHDTATAYAGKPEADATGAARLPAIVLVIDDLGPDVARTRRAMALPGAVALSFLPYGEQTPGLAVAAERAGHDVLAHVPMQPLGHENPGPMVLKPGMSAREITRRLKWDLSRVPGLVGINNHMGSRFTQDREGLIPVMRMLMYRNLFFFDSVTAPHTQGMKTARAFGILSASRDVFLDDDISKAAVARQLKILEHVASHQGIALAIGHPHDITLDALEAWCAGLHGYRLVRIREGLRMKTERDMGIPLAALGRPVSR